MYLYAYISTLYYSRIDFRSSAIKKSIMFLDSVLMRSLSVPNSIVTYLRIRIVESRIEMIHSEVECLVFHMKKKRLSIF